MHAKSHTVIRLALHLPLEQTIIYEPGDEDIILEKNNNSTLTAWFELNQRDLSARRYTYVEIPDYYVFDRTTKQWIPRQKGIIK